MTRVGLVFLFFGLVSTGLAKTFSKCELVHELRRQNFPENLMKDLVCLIGASSSYRTHVVGGPDKDGSYNHGLFQINDRYWCEDGPQPGKGCNVRCSDLLSEDITTSANCAKIVLDKRGLGAWVGWVNNCQGIALPELNC